MVECQHQLGIQAVGSGFSGRLQRHQARRSCGESPAFNFLQRAAIDAAQLRIDPRCVRFSAFQGWIGVEDVCARIEPLPLALRRRLQRESRRQIRRVCPQRHNRVIERCNHSRGRVDIRSIRLGQRVRQPQVAYGAELVTDRLSDRKTLPRARLRPQVDGHIAIRRQRLVRGKHQRRIVDPGVAPHQGSLRFQRRFNREPVHRLVEIQDDRAIQAQLHALHRVGLDDSRRQSLRRGRWQRWRGCGRRHRCGRWRGAAEYRRRRASHADENQRQREQDQAETSLNCK